jgi:hypothetical protein
MAGKLAINSAPGKTAQSVPLLTDASALRVSLMN